MRIVTSIRGISVERNIYKGRIPLYSMVIKSKKLLKDNDKSYWGLINLESESIYYFLSESAALNYTKKHKLKDFMICPEGKN